MKKFISLALIAAMLVSLTACNNAQTSSAVASDDKSSMVEESASTTTESKEDSTVSADSDTDDFASESSDISDDKYEIKITDEKYGEKAYIVEGVKTVVKDGKTYTVGGDFDDGCIIDDIWLPEMRPEYPTGDDFVCWDSMTEFFGIYDYVNTDTIIDDIQMSTDFYYDDNGQLWGPSRLNFYIGDPRTDFSLCPHFGCQIVEVIAQTMRKKKLKVVIDTDMVYTLYEGSEEDDNGTKWMNEKIVGSKEPVVTYISTFELGKFIWKSNSEILGERENAIATGCLYGLIIGEYKNHFIVFVPSIQKILAYSYSDSYNPLIDAASLEYK